MDGVDVLPTYNVQMIFPSLSFIMFQPSNSECSLLPHDHFWIHSKRIVTPEGVISGAVEIRGGNIGSIVKDKDPHEKVLKGHVVDYGEAVVMPGLVDVHVHLDEPGRAEWEGFYTGTRAAAAGGVTTLIDMPLNSFPSTVSEETLRLKVEAAQDKLYVDVGFWGGLVPDNAFNKSALEGLLKAGVLGLKSFMCPSGINDFPMTNASHIKEALSTLADYDRPLLVHSEIQLDFDSTSELKDGVDDPRSYSTYLKTRPPSWEEAAIKELLSIIQDKRTSGHQWAHLHIVHLSDASASLDLIKGAKSSGARLSVETCPHYLAFSAENIPDRDTRFKCAPPIRDAANNQKLWEALMDGHIDMLSSDHSPSVPELKLFDEGDFLRAWGGISSLQVDTLLFSWLALFFLLHGHLVKKYGITLNQLASWWCERPAKLAGQELKGTIMSGKHADLVVWEPDADFVIDESYSIYHKHPLWSLQMLLRLLSESKKETKSIYQPTWDPSYQEKFLATFVRGSLVYSDGKHAPTACGVPILAK
ncbi:Amidohydrolase 1 [Cinnamomum micranthum f. kanehirae]|uniref:allantoinase n=1 Tax=Cinnamomum micranthum f. kanehirae TaxID=337451 RepID=A0A3S3QZB3_9MAGN|nr:Amidohydrolase 1 [Cinnamomum micranthum f. kanehirae]